MRKREGREKEEREKKRNNERGERNSLIKKGRESIKLLFFYPIQLQYHLTFRWYCSTILKKFSLPKFSLPIAKHFLGLYAKCTLHLAYGKPTVDALSRV